MGNLKLKLYDTLCSVSKIRKFKFCVNQVSLSVVAVINPSILIRS